MPQTKAYFSIERDRQIINGGGFFCCGCLAGKHGAERSPKDARYCVLCQPTIENEYRIIASRRGKPLEAFYRPVTPSLQAKERDLALAPAHGTCHEIVHANKGRERGLYRKKELPQGLIRQLADDGIGARAIATRLKKAHALDVSYKTVERVLSGERQQPEQAALPIL